MEANRHTFRHACSVAQAVLSLIIVSVLLSPLLYCHSYTATVDIISKTKTTINSNKKITEFLPSSYKNPSQLHGHLHAQLQHVCDLNIKLSPRFAVTASMY